jgi:Di-haem oxidoreductase, putative peroxidase
MKLPTVPMAIGSLGLLLFTLPSQTAFGADLGKEVSIPRHLQDGEEFTTPIAELNAYGLRLFDANWTTEEGGGRPLAKGTGSPLSDPSEPLVFPRNFNRLSGPDANACSGCHNSPLSGGNGDIVGNVFVLGQRFDFATLNRSETVPTKGNVDERGSNVTVQTFANSRATLGMFGSGYIEMLARQMTADLQAERDATPPGETTVLTTKGVSFGQIVHRQDGTWDVSGLEGLVAPSLATSGTTPPNLIVRPFHQAGAVVSLRQFSVNAFVQHHGIQATERFGVDTDPDGDGHANEMTRADVTAVSVFQATMAVPGRMIPNDPDVEAAVLNGENRFMAVGCATCHVPNLPLEKSGWVFTEPNPYNPPGNLRPGEAPTFSVDLNDRALPQPRLEPIRDTIYVPAFTDLKLHDITAGNGDPNIEPLDMTQAGGSPEFFAGNHRFLTRKLWGAASKPNFFHHGLYTTMRQAILAHAGEAATSREAFNALDDYDRDSIIEFLKTLKNLPPGTKSLFVDEKGQPKQWPPARLQKISHGPHHKLALAWAGNSGLYAPPRLFQLQKSPSLNSPHWSNVGGPTAANGAEIEASGNVGFFRLQPVK